MALTAAQATARLSGITSPEQLRALIAELDVSAGGDVTVLYSGKDAWRTAQTLFAQGENIRIIDNTQASKFLNVANNRILAEDPETGNDIQGERYVLCQ